MMSNSFLRQSRKSYPYPMNSLVKKIILPVSAFVLLLSANCPAYAQQEEMVTVHIDSTLFKLNMMSVDDYYNLNIPSFEVLFENARNNNAVKYFLYEAEYYRSQLKTEKKKPLAWINLIASYSYGNMNMAAVMLMQTTYQVWTQNTSTQRNQYYSVGATLTIPLIDLFDRRNKIREADAKMLENKYRMESEVDRLKSEIIAQYCLIVEKIAELKNAAELLVVAQGQYDFGERDFVNNRINAEDLYRSKNYESSAIQEYQIIKRELNEAILQLEILSCTPIVTDFKLVSSYK